MRCLGFQFQVGLSRRSAVALFFALAGTASVSGQSAFTWKYESRSLGAANRYGYASWYVPLASLSLNGSSIPIRAEFTTDPRPDPSPSPLGKGWSVNLFVSALVEVDQDSIRWHRPDGRIFYFILERGNTSTKKPNPDAPIVFKSKDDTWLALKTPKKRIVTLRHQESGAELVYEEGLLSRFTFAKSTADTEQYSISYNRLRRPTRLTMRGTGKVIAEFVYDDAHRAKEFRIGDAGDPLAKVISFEYAEAPLNRVPAGPYLTKLGDAALTPLAISYTPQGGDANRIQFERLNSTGITYLTWDALSGFIRDDQGATYKIENPSLANEGRPVLDPKSKPAELPEGQKAPEKIADYNWRPDEAKVTKTDRDGKSEYKFYDRDKGILTETNKDGVKTVTSYLLTPGPMHGKVRKVEETKGKTHKIIELNAYDELGRQVRKIDSAGIVSIWEYLEGGKQVRKTTNGQISQELQYDDAKRLLKNKLYSPTGTEEYLYTYTGTLKSVRLLQNDTEVWTKLYEEGKGIIEYTKAGGEKFTWRYENKNGLDIVSQINPDGTTSQLKN